MTTLTAKEILGKALGKVASGIYILTTGTGENKTGMLASWVVQAGFEPPMVTVAVGKDRDILKTLGDNPRFVLNVLSESNSNLMGRFSKYKPEQFDGLEIFESTQGPVLRETVAYLSCEVKHNWTGGDHNILLAEIVEGEILNDDLTPWTHLRKNGFVY